MNQTAVIEGIRHAHHALSACIHDDLDNAENSLRLALAHLFECVPWKTRLDLVREYREELGLQDGDGCLHQIETRAGSVMLLPDGLWWGWDNDDPLRPVVPLDSEQFKSADERTRIALRAIADHLGKDAH